MNRPLHPLVTLLVGALLGAGLGALAAWGLPRRSDTGTLVTGALLGGAAGLALLGAVHGGTWLYKNVPAVGESVRFGFALGSAVGLALSCGGCVLAPGARRAAGQPQDDGGTLQGRGRTAGVPRRLRRRRLGEAAEGVGTGPMYGYHGGYLRIDLTSGSSEWVPLPEGVLRRFVGGVGLATYLMHRECPRG